MRNKLQRILLGIFLLSACTAEIPSKTLEASVVETGTSQAETEQTYKEVLVVGAAESGYVDGSLAQARFASFADVVFDENNNFYVADAGNNVIRYVDLQKGEVSTFAGQAYELKEEMQPAETYRDGAAEQALFRSPVSLALTPDGALYVADSANHKVRKVHQGQVSTLLGNSPDNKPPGSKKGVEAVLRVSGNLQQATTFFPRLLRLYQGKYLFLFERFSTSRFIDLEKRVIESVPDTFGKGLSKEPSSEVWYSQFGDITDIVFDDKGGVWVDSLGYAIQYLLLNGKKKIFIGDNKSIIEEGFSGYRWSVAQKDGDFENFSFFSTRGVLQGTAKNYLFVHDFKPESRRTEEPLSTLRLVDLKKRFVSTIPRVEDFKTFFISPDDELYIVRGERLYRVQPSPVKSLISGEHSL